MAKLLTALTTGLLEIWAHKTRSFLSFLTMTIGVAALLYTFAITEGSNQRMKKAMELSGPGRMSISKKRDYKSKGLSPGLTYNDAAVIRESFPDLYMISPETQMWGSGFVFKDFKDDNFMAMGLTPDWAKREWVFKLRGRFLKWDDVRQNAKVCVLIEPGGWRKKPAWLKFWGIANSFENWITRRDLLGETVVIGNQSFVVVGIIKEPIREDDPRWFRGGSWGTGRGIIPITTIPSLKSKWGWSPDNETIDEIDIDTGDEKTLALYKKKIDILLKARHRGEEDYEIRAYAEMFAERLAENRKMAVAIMIMGLVCILAGGIGIMNVTLATIYSRIREIGIRRAVGASRGDILLQFVIEAMLLGLLGGVFGIGLGLIGINTFLKELRWMDIATFQIHHFLAALGIAAGTGFIFSVYPAWMAARLDPVEALHYE
ncbi:MAG: ABC transporter permease [Elusimicrobia bacterium]|nr:ABC transporter permease [Elusimicrobiota bacterium]